MSMSDEARYSGPKREKRYKKRKKKGFKETFIPQKHDSTSEVISKIVSLCAIVVVIVCLVILAGQLYESIEAKNNHNDLKGLYQQAQQLVINPTVAETEPPATAIDSAGQTVTVPPQELPPPEELPAAKELIALNPDTVGYVRIPDCVDEPVVQGSDNDYYLNHNFYGSQRQCGTCFADYRNRIEAYDQSDNIILYAHNQKDGTMFGHLDYYRWDAAYWLKNPFIYFNSNYSEDTYVIISSFVINTLPEHDDGKELFDYQNYVEFNDTYTFERFCEEITERSSIITGVSYDENDKYLTLSTCSYEWDEARHVLVARKLRDGETAESIDTTAFSRNPNPKWPAIYYKYNGGTYIDD